MANLAKKKLLRALMAASLAGWVSPGFADDGDGAAKPTPPVVYAPGATSVIKAPIEDIVRGAERQSDELAQRLQIQPPRSDLGEMDFEGMRERALENPRVRRLLGTDAGEEDAEGSNGEEKYETAKGFVFASFTMPEPSLRQAMRDANRFGMTVVFRGFVEGSVFATRTKLEAVFSEDEMGEAFAIDPTLFKRFGISSVPVVVVLAEQMGECDTPLCDGDPAPRHDRLSGNIPLETALRIVAAGGGEASDKARYIVEGDRQ